MSHERRHRSGPSAPRRPRPGARPGAAATGPAAPRAGERTSRLERLILDLWARTRMDWGFAATRLSAVVRQERWLGSGERRQVLETVYGMVRHSRRIDFALEAAGARLSAGTVRELARYLAYRVLTGELGVAEAATVLPEVAWDAVAGVGERIDREREAATRLGLAHSLPDWLAARLLAEHGEEAEALAASLNERAPLVLRVNTLRASREGLLERFAREGIEARPTSFSPHGVVLASRIDVFGLEAYREGLFEVQDEGSQLIAELVSPPPKGTVVDACAGAGGKTLALAAAMEGKGRLLALDVDARKLEELKKRARRAGLSSVQALHTEATVWPHDVGALLGRVERVLVDAPCTGIGSLRRNPELRWRVEAEDVAGFAQAQEQLLRRALELVGVGGRVIYATCSLLREENEAVVDRVLAGAPRFTRVPLASVLGPERAASVGDASGAYLKTLPHRHGTDGFFAAVLERKA